MRCASLEDSSARGRRAPERPPLNPDVAMSDPNDLAFTTLTLRVVGHETGRQIFAAVLALSPAGLLVLAAGLLGSFGFAYGDVGERSPAPPEGHSRE